MATHLHHDLIPHQDSIFAMLPPVAKTPAVKPKKRLIRRTDRDYSQKSRLGFQAAFLAMCTVLAVGGCNRASAPRASAEETLTIGGIMPLSGPVSTVGQA